MNIYYIVYEFQKQRYNMQKSRTNLRARLIRVNLRH